MSLSCWLCLCWLSLLAASLIIRSPVGHGIILAVAVGHLLLYITSLSLLYITYYFTGCLNGLQRNHTGAVGIDDFDNKHWLGNQESCT